MAGVLKQFAHVRPTPKIVRPTPKRGGSRKKKIPNAMILSIVDYIPSCITTICSQ